MWGVLSLRHWLSTGQQWIALFTLRVKELKYLRGSCSPLRADTVEKTVAEGETLSLAEHLHFNPLFTSANNRSWEFI